MKDKEQESINRAILILEHIMESDPRNFKNQVAENGWLFDRVYEALKLLKPLETEY